MPRQLLEEAALQLLDFAQEHLGRLLQLCGDGSLDALDELLEEALVLLAVQVHFLEGSEALLEELDALVEL